MRVQNGKWVGDLTGARVAVLVSDGFEQTQYEEVVWDLRRAGAEIEVLAATPEQREDGIQALHGLERGRTVKADCLAAEAKPERYDALLILGGPISADSMRESQFHLSLIRNFTLAEKPIAAVGHGCWLLADAGVLRDGRSVTSVPSIRKDIEKAGAVWKSGPVSHDRNVFTIRGSESVDELMRVFAPEIQRAALHRANNSEKMTRKAAAS